MVTGLQCGQGNGATWGRVGRSPALILADAALAQALGWLDANVREINFGL